MVHGRPPTGRAQKFPSAISRSALLQLGVGQQPLEPGVLLLQLLEALGVFGLETPELVAPPEVGLLADTQPARDLGGIGALGEQRSAPVSFRTTCSGVCRFLFVDMV
jgi:hypothetical protein